MRRSAITGLATAWIPRDETASLSWISLAKHQVAPPSTRADMKTSHQGLGITTEEYDVLMVHCVASLEACGVGEAEKTDVCGFMNSLREEIVEA